jgi:hypothetical protein
VVIGHDHHPWRARYLTLDDNCDDLGDQVHRGFGAADLRVILAIT